MSYSEKLFDNITLANQHASLGKKAVDELVIFFKQLVNIEENYAKTLENLGNFQFLLIKGSTLQACQSLKQDISSKAQQIRVFTDNLSQDIIKPLQLISSQSQESIKSLYSESSKVMKIKESYLDKLTKLKDRFFKSCSECEKFTSLLEQPQSQSQREKYLQKLIKHKNLLDSSLKNYEEHLNTWPNFMLAYQPLVVPIMNSYEKTEQNRLMGVKDQLRKFVIYETSYIRNLQYEIDSLAKSMEDIHIENDLKNNCPVSFPWQAPEFEPYKGSHPAYKSITTSGLSISIPLPIQEAKWSEIVFQGSIEEMYKTEIDIITLKATQGYDLISEDFIQFNSLIKDSLGRRAWVWSMNQKKLEPILSDKGFLHLGELMLSVLNECERTGDMQTTKITLQYSSAFHKVSSGIKHYLYKLISNHSLWLRGDVWEKVIEMYINDEIISHNVFTYTSKEEDRKKIVRNIVFCQLGAITEIMAIFSVNLSLASEVIQKFVAKYELPSADLEVLLTTVSGKKEKEVRVLTVQRGIPAWLQELEPSSSTIKRGTKTLSELLTKDKP